MKTANNKKFFNIKVNKLVKTKGLPFTNLVSIAFAVNILVIAFVFVFNKQLPPQVPLFYGLPKTTEQVVNSVYLIIPSAVSTAILLINLLIAQLIKGSFLKKTLILTGVVGTFFSAITTIKIFFLVGSF